MPDICEEVGKTDSGAETGLRGRGISQEELAQAMKTMADTISRWETATYKPSISDLEQLAQSEGGRIHPLNGDGMPRRPQ